MPHPLAALKRRLEKWELDHLRQLTTELSERLERAEEDALLANEYAESWRDSVFALQETLSDTGTQLGLTIDGDLVTLPSASPTIADGETYIGAIINADGTGYHIILLPGDHDDAPWAAAIDWAASIGGELPSRIEQALLYANHKDQFKREWYWSSDQHAAYTGYAWCQRFGLGNQNNYDTHSKLRARAVRRVPI